MQKSREDGVVDDELLEDFRSSIKSRVPRLDAAGRVADPTPLVDLTDVLVECAKVEYGTDLSGKMTRVFGKMDSKIFGGSVKVRPAVQILESAIVSGKLRRGQTLFEATSGNFGLALGLLKGLGFKVVVLVSRRLQVGVVDQLRKDGLDIADLDIDICPAPGLKVDPNLAVAKGVAASMRNQLLQFGLDAGHFDESIAEVEELLAKQDVINLAKLLARIYGGFCPEQYDNVQNVEAHEMVTGPELDQQLTELGASLNDFEVLCAFGTGGTSAGLSRYVQKKYGRKSVRVVFPLGDQDVAGIRTKQKAAGLRFYDPRLYAGEHEVDFEAAERTLNFFAARGFDIGESSALALYACIQLSEFGSWSKYVVVLADGLSKYAGDLETKPKRPLAAEVSFEKAVAEIGNYGEVLWTHGMFTPTQEGVKLVASALGVSEDSVKVASARDVRDLLGTQKVPDSMKGLVSKGRGRVLVVCMAGGTSLAVARILTHEGVEAQSLSGGIGGLSSRMGKPLARLVQNAGQ